MRLLSRNWDRVTGWAVALLGAIVLYTGWDHVSDTGYPAEQLPYILSAGIGGALLMAFGATLLVSADLRDLWHKMDRFDDQMSDLRQRLDRVEAAASDAGPSQLGGNRRLPRASASGRV